MVVQLMNSVFLNFSLPLGGLKPFNRAGSLSAMRRDAENCPSCSLEQYNFETHSWERSSSAE